ncbi:MAG: long-chain fatty acid--CoA ligase [Bdellovibrionota bacterium]
METDWLKRLNQLKPANLALTDGETAETLTYRDLYRWSLSLASRLNKLNIKTGDRVSCLASNSLEYVALFFALQRLGAVLVPINFRLTAREVDHIVSDSDSKVLFYEPQFLEIVENLKHRPHNILPLTGSEGVRQSFKDGQEQYTEFKGQSDDAVMILYTSGTTGFPKGAILTHKMLFWNSVNTALSIDLSEKDCAVIFLPFFHTGGWNVLTTPFFHRGGHIVLLKKFDPGAVLALSARYRATLLFGVPTTMEMMSRTHHFNEIDLSWIRYAIVGGEPMPVPLIEKWHAKQIPIRQGYGLTEFGPNVFSLHHSDVVKKAGSIGFPNFYVHTKVVDASGKPVAAGEIGELLLQGPMMMQGYWKNPTATAETIKDGWLHTGDLVRFDSEGYFYVVGRKKEMFISGGENVYPAEVEQVISQMPGVREVAVVGVPDSKWGEVGLAFVVTDFPMTETQVLDYAKGNLAKFKIPKAIQFVDSLPKGESGKILKKSLKELAVPTSHN